MTRQSDNNRQPTLTVVDSRGALLAVLGYVVRVAYENGTEYGQYGDPFHNGMVMGYYDILTNIRIAAERYGVSLDQIGMESMDPEKELFEPMRQAADRS